MLNNIPDQPVRCDACKRIFSNLTILNRHLVSNHTCVECQAFFKYKSQLRGHIAGHRSHAVCSECKKILSPDPSNLRIHKRRSHPNSDSYAIIIEKPPIACTYCQITFPNSNDLYQHVQEQHNAHSPYADLILHTYQCEICRSSFANRYKLQSHLANAHRSKSPYVFTRQCKICSQRFDSQADLWSHLDAQHQLPIPPGPPPPISASSFTDPYASGYTCNQCNIVFDNPFDLDTHLQQVHNRHCIIS